LKDHAIPVRATRQYFLLAIVVLVHLLCASELLLVRQQEAFFWPMLVAPLLCPFFVRRSIVVLDLPTGLVAGVGGACCVAAIIAALSGQPWWALLSFSVYSSAILWKQTSKSGRNLSRFSLLFFLFAGLPPVYAAKVWAWWTNAVADVTSVWASLTQLWHTRGGSTLLFLDGAVDMELVCSGFFSLPFVVLVGLTRSFWMRRSLVQSTLLALIGVFIGTAGRITVGFLTSWLVHEGWGEIAVAGAHAFILLLSLSLMVCSDSLIVLLTASVPSQEALDSGGKRSNVNVEDLANENPVTDLWNRYVSATGFNNRVGPVPFVAPNGELVAIGNALREFCSGWLMSRDLSLLLAGALVALICVLTTGSIVGSDSGTSDIQLLYREVLVKAQAADDSRLQELCLRRLIQLDKDGLGREQDLAEFYWSKERYDEAWEIMERHAALAPHGLASAHVWLAEKGTSPNAPRQLSREEIISHLQACLKTSPNLPQAHRALADYSIARKDWAEANIHLTKLVESDPGITRQLLRIRLQLGVEIATDLEWQERVVELRRRVLGQRFSSSDVQELVELFLLGQRFSDANRIAEQAFATEDSPETRRILAALKISEARILASGRIVQPKACTELVQEALELDPACEAGLLLGAELVAAGASLELSNAQEIEDFWRIQSRQRPQPAGTRDGLVAILEIQGKCEEALLVLGDAQASDLRELETRIRLLRRTDRLSEAETELKKYLDTTGIAQVHGKSRRKVAELLAVAGLYDDARGLLPGKAEEISASGGNDGLFQPGDCSALAKVCLIEFDALVGHPGMFSVAARTWTPEIPADQSPDYLVGLLKNALQCPRSRLAAVDRLTRLVLSDEIAVASTEQLLLQLRSEGDDLGNILRLMGTRAAESGQVASAVTWLEMASRLSDGDDPVLMNNLAVALVRADGQDNAIVALRLLNRAREIDKQNSEILASRGEVNLFLRDWSAACRDLQESLRLNPQQPGVHRLLAEVWTDLGLYRKAHRARLDADLLESGLLPNRG